MILWKNILKLRGKSFDFQVQGTLKVTLFAVQDKYDIDLLPFIKSFVNNGFSH